MLDCNEANGGVESDLDADDAAAWDSSGGGGAWERGMPIGSGDRGGDGGGAARRGGGTECLKLGVDGGLGGGAGAGTGVLRLPGQRAR